MPAATGSAPTMAPEPRAAPTPAPPARAAMKRAAPISMPAVVGSRNDRPRSIGLAENIVPSPASMPVVLKAEGRFAIPLAAHDAAPVWEP